MAASDARIRYLLSESVGPWMHAVGALADTLAKNRTSLPHDYPLLEQERQFTGQISTIVERATQYLDAAEEQAFRLLYGA